MLFLLFIFRFAALSAFLVLQVPALPAPSAGALAKSHVRNFYVYYQSASNVTLYPSCGNVESVIYFSVYLFHLFIFIGIYLIYIYIFIYLFTSSQLHSVLTFPQLEDDDVR